LSFTWADPSSNPNFIPKDKEKMRSYMYFIVGGGGAVAVVAVVVVVVVLSTCCDIEHL
jgi:hypothetical protein